MRHETDLAAIDTRGPVEIAPNTYWVGSLHPDHRLQTHAYLLDAGDQSVLIDPGSSLTIEATLAKVRAVLDPRQVRWVVCHDADPDACAGLPALDGVVGQSAAIVTEWRAAALLRHYGSRLPLHLIEEHDWALDLGDGRRLEFTLTPYLHFPGALCAYDAASRVLFTGDLFGGFTRGEHLWAGDESSFEAARAFHEHYMPSGDILRAGLATLRRRWPDPDVIAPHHGQILPSRLVAPMFARLSTLECGIVLQARGDLDLGALLQASDMERKLEQALLASASLPVLAERALGVLREHLPVTGLEAYVATEDEGLVLFADADQFVGSPVSANPHRSGEPFLSVGGDGTLPPTRVYLLLAEDAELPRQFATALVRLAEPIRVAFIEHLQQRRARQDHQRMLTETLTDHLTGLHNRRILNGLYAASDPGAVLMIDLDRFKEINDAHGHDAGDAALRQVATVIQANIRSQSDLGVRYGGDEFLAVLREADETLALQVAERIRHQIELLSLREPEAGHLSVSIGVTRRASGEPLELAITRADRVLRTAKAEGRNRIATAW
ncbi:MAG: diguanylate cyclase [Acidimicrobiales bacterium]